MRTKILAAFWCDPNDWNAFTAKHPRGASKRIRDWIREDLEKDVELVRVVKEGTENDTKKH